ncbi:MAG TPA: helix-hairpin-helix domain-containing protein [Gemmatimonadaceae bacterium]|nr:helix-hairpin-helix domain-containing protein [Gemmatimonadaceae bacterium]
MTKYFGRGLSFLTMILALGAFESVQAQVGKSVTIVDANSATEAQLKAIPGLTEALVKEIVAKRPFASITQLDAVLAPLSKEQRTEVYKKTFVHINLNTASKDEILLIPGVGNRMLHEFEEYRPYKNLAQFHREIDKYVDDTELARLEQYVFVPINLNTASDADILTIPGLGSKMLHEFKEYRPYPAIEKFRREIGKYVNAKEVARFERFVTIQ